VKQHLTTRRLIAAAAAMVAVPAVAMAGGLTADASPATGTGHANGQPSPGSSTTTPIKHLVVLFDENVSFDHYFGTYPVAANNGDGPTFTAAPGTPTVNGLTPALLTANPNSAQPTRLTPQQAVTCSQNHGYTAEQNAFDHGLMDKFVEFTQSTNCSSTGAAKPPGLVMDYYDGNTVTALWNYAQNYAMSDNSYDTDFGPSTVGALNLVSGQTHGATPAVIPGSADNGTVIGDPDPALDDCGKGGVTMSGKNIGDLLNAKDVTWGWFQGGFAPTGTDTTGKAICGSTHQNVAGGTSSDYSPHHNPFEYYASTANPHHVAPSSPAMIGRTDQANHEYDLSAFWTAVDGGAMPAVSFLKAAQYQDAHPGNSDPIDEQHFVVDTINRLQKSPDWKDTAVVIAYDDSDGWYDHQMSPIVEKSASAEDVLTGPGSCGTMRTAGNSGGSANLDAYADRCGYGPRLPMLVISPYAKTNFVDHTVTDQTSILKFIEDNWSTGRIGDDSFDAIAGPITTMLDFSQHPNDKPVLLDPRTGQPTHH
jgi:phospholipase C